MAVDGNKSALYSSQLVLQNTDFHAKHGPSGTENLCLVKSSDGRTVVDEKVLALEAECVRLREELEGQRHLNEALMVQNDTIDSKWRELVTDYEQKFQACEKRLQKNSNSDMSSEETRNGLNGVKIDSERANAYEGETMSDWEYQKLRMANGSETRLDVANAVADKENAEVQEVSSLRAENAELRELIQNAMRNQQQLSRDLAEKAKDAKEKEQENAELKLQLSRAEAESAELNDTLTSVREENKKLSSEIEILRDKISKLKGANERVETVKAAEEQKSDAGPARSDAVSEPKPTAKPRNGVVLREPKARTAPNFYRHSIAAGSLPRPFMDYSAPERKKSFGADNGNSEPSFLQRKVNASYLNAFKPRPFNYKPINFNPRQTSTEGAEGTEAHRETDAKCDAKECEQESSTQANQEPWTQSSGREESEGANQPEAASCPARDVSDGKAGIQYESDEDEELMRAKKDKVNALRDMWSTKSEVMDV